MHDSIMESMQSLKHHVPQQTTQSGFVTNLSEVAMSDLFVTCLFMLNLFIGEGGRGWVVVKGISLQIPTHHTLPFVLSSIGT